MNLFFDNLELNLDSITANDHYLVVLLGYLNAQSSTWYNPEKGRKFTVQHPNLNYNWLHDSTHKLNGLSSCIGFILISRPNLVMDSGFHSSLHQNCHHHIVCAKFDLRIYYTPNLKIWTRRLALWQSKTDLIRKAINGFCGLTHLRISKQRPTLHK